MAAADNSASVAYFALGAIFFLAADLSSGPGAAGQAAQ
jgi:hypothetical protein